MLQQGFLFAGKFSDTTQGGLTGMVWEKQCRRFARWIAGLGTQLRNIPADRLYEKNGFRRAAGSFTLRKNLDA